MFLVDVKKSNLSTTESVGQNSTKSELYETATIVVNDSTFIVPGTEINGEWKFYTYDYSRIMCKILCYIYLNVVLKNWFANVWWV